MGVANPLSCFVKAHPCTHLALNLEAVMATVNQTNPQQPQDVDPHPRSERMPELIIYSHSNLFYWWPIWVTGFIFALLTYLQAGDPYRIGGRDVLIHPSKNLG